MVSIKTCAIGLLALPGLGAGAEPVALREAVRPGAATRVVIELKAQGQYLPALPPGVSKDQAPRALALKVESRLEFVERSVGSGDRPRTVRRVLRAGSAINGEVRPASATVRPEVALLVAEARGGGVVVFSPLGPLTRSELEVLQGPGDPLALGGLLPDRPVAVGDRWPVGESAVKALTAYDTRSGGGLEATLEAADAATARVRVRGEVRGSVLGGRGVGGVRRRVHVRPHGGPGRPAGADPRRDPAPGAGGGGPGRQEHADRHARGGRGPPPSWPTRRSRGWTWSRPPSGSNCCWSRRAAGTRCGTTATGTSTGTTRG